MRGRSPSRQVTEITGSQPALTFHASCPSRVRTWALLIQNQTCCQLHQGAVELRGYMETVGIEPLSLLARQLCSPPHSGPLTIIEQPWSFCTHCSLEHEHHDTADTDTFDADTSGSSRGHTPFREGSSLSRDCTSCTGPGTSPAPLPCAHETTTIRDAIPSAKDRYDLPAGPDSNHTIHTVRSLPTILDAALEPTCVGTLSAYLGPCMASYGVEEVGTRFILQ